MSKLKRLIYIALVISMITTFVPTYASAAELPKEFNTYEPVLNERYDFAPPHKYETHQNPPDFTWPDSENVTSWEIVVCSDPELKDVKYSKTGIEDHFYNFQETFEPGTYWWAIRGKIGNTVTNWSVARRFRLDPDHTVYTPPTAEELYNKIPKAHPRILFTQETWDNFVKEKTSTELGKKYWENLSTETEKWMSDLSDLNVSDVDTQAGGEYDHQANIANRDMIGQFGDRAKIAALAYWYTGNSEYADYAVTLMEIMSTWNVDSGITSYDYNDQTYWYIAGDFSTAYDWLYNYMTKEQRKTVGDALYERFIKRADADLEILYTNETDSHMRSHLDHYVFTTTALMHEYSDIDKYFIDVAAIALNTESPFCVEDGGYAKGRYGSLEFGDDGTYLDFWKEAGLVDMYNKQAERNEWLTYTYMYPKYSFGNFGDGAITDMVDEPNQPFGFALLAERTNNPVAQWEANNRGGIDVFRKNYVQTYLIAYKQDSAEVKEPVDMPRAWCSFDTGFVGMHSDLVSLDKVSLYFRSGPYGTYNHMRSDQNAFVIEAHGESLASHSGFYDYYRSKHDFNFTRKTYASNNITFDGGQGQPWDDYEAKGNVDMFAASSEFDAVVGDATPAYKGRLSKYVRSIIYVRPDQYIVVDDLAAGSSYSEGSVFEWWLNADKPMKLHEDGKGAAIVGERSILNARIQYPEKVSPYYSNLFSGPDLVDYKPTDAYPQSGHERIWWETDRVKSTKIVSTISVDDINGTSAYVKTTNGENFMKLEFENGTVAYVNLSTEPDSKVIADNVEFIGTAVVLNEKDIMLVGGTSLTVGGKMIVESDRLTTVSIANNTLTVSSNDDFNVSVGTKNKYIDGITSIKERDGSELSKLKGNVLISDTKMAEQLLNKEDKTMFNGVASIADSDIVEPDFNAEKINISADKGYYSYLLNDQVLPGHKTGNKLTFDLIIDGVKKNFEGEAFLDHDYKESAYIKGVKLDNHRYKLVGKSKNLEFMDGFINVNNGNVVFDGVYNFKVKGEGNYLELEINDPKKVTSAVYEDAESWKNNTAVFIEAESFISSTGSSKFTVDFKDFASGGKTIRDVDVEKDTVTYSFNVSENGVYDFVMCIASWVTPSPNLTIVLDGEEMTIPLQFTGGWGGNKQADFDAIISDINCSLNAGEHTLVIKGAHFEDAQNWNLDWIGFIKK